MEMPLQRDFINPKRSQSEHQKTSTFLLKLHALQRVTFRRGGRSFSLRPQAGFRVAPFYRSILSLTSFLLLLFNLSLAGLIFRNGKPSSLKGAANPATERSGNSETLPGAADLQLLPKSSANQTPWKDCHRKPWEEFKRSLTLHTQTLNDLKRSTKGWLQRPETYNMGGSTCPVLSSVSL